MKILQICDTLSVANGGPARNSFELNRALNNIDGITVDLVWIRGHQGESVLTGESLPAPSSALPGPRKLVFSRGPSVKRSIGLASLARALRASDAVIIHGFYLPWVPLVLSAATLLGKNVFLMPHGALTAYETARGARKKALFRRTIYRLFRRRLRAFAVGSDDEARDASALLPGVPAVTCGVGTAIVERPPARDTFKPLRLLTLCRLAQKKRVDVSILALAALMRSGVDARLTIAGTGPERASLERLAHAEGVAERVDFVGQVAGRSKDDLYRGSDVFVLASEDENFGIVVAEALAHGLPTVASRHVQSAALAAHSPAVELIDAPDADLVAAAVINLLANDYPLLQEAAVTVARREYSWDSVGMRWVAMILSAARSDVV